MNQQAISAFNKLSKQASCALSASNSAGDIISSLIDEMNDEQNKQASIAYGVLLLIQETVNKLEGAQESAMELYKYLHTGE
ncbi:hypothetical protein QFS06_001430 [Escherichia coli]|nr:hypothetical protein [Escherichia coli]